jgi:penicillin-binding protein 2
MAIKDMNKERRFVIIGVFILAALALLFRAAQLQLMDQTYQTRANAITIDKDIIFPSRGVIYDRHQNLMVYNNAQYDLMATYKLIDPKMDTLKFCRLLGIDTTTFRLNLDKDFKSKNAPYSKSIPFPFLTMITPEMYAKLQESLYEFPGFRIQLRNVRGYPQHNAGNILGYLNEVNTKQVKDSLGFYEAGDYIGATGLEKYYESVLRGRKGVRFTIKDNLGRLVSPWKEGKLDTTAVQGKDLVSTVDMKLQALGEYMMFGKIGAIIAIEPKSGEILAMVTSPTFDPQNLTVGKQRSAFMNSLTKDSLNPLFNRAVSAKYPPGSIFKPMLAAIALQQGVWDKNNGVPCPGGYYYNGRRLLKCDADHHHPYPGNLAAAIQYSCNAYFATVFRAMVDQYGFNNASRGLDSLNVYLDRFGMGRRLDIDFPSEKKGNVPSGKYYDKVYKKDKFWYSTAIVSNGIGQGENQLTTMQMANLAAIIANRGWYIIPHLIKGYKDSTNQADYKVLDPKFSVVHSTGVEAQHFEYVIDGMRRVIQSGTGDNAQVNGIDICGKTGTSQNPHGKDNSVFIGLAPANDPKIVVAVYVENGGWGNDFAAPITGLMIEQFLKGEIPVGRKGVVERMHNARLGYSSGTGYYVVKGGY